VKIPTLDVFDTMRTELELVEARIAEASSIGIPMVSDLIHDVVTSGGKRLRPTLLLLAGRGFDYERDRLVTAAAGVELLHTASLVHDDSIDQATIRRGRPTLNARLGTGAVIMLGDFLFAQAAILAAETGIPRVVAAFSRALGDICDGQLREMFSAHQLDQTTEEYELRIYGKTASLFAASAEMGAILGNAPEPAISELRSFGSDIGMAFQILDDILDLRGDPADLGKPSGNDLRQGTITLPVMRYWESLDPDSPEGQRLFAVATGETDRPEDIEAVLEAIRASGAIDQAMASAEAYVARAKQRLAVVPDRETRSYLAEIADYMLVRTR
jgi:geranylgeranyl pyrophosphate synthase